MIHRFTPIALLVGLISVSCGQIPASGQQSRSEKFLWNPKDSQELGPRNALIRAKTLRAADRDFLITAIAKALKPEQSGELQVSIQKWRVIAANSRVKLVDLNGDGIPEVIVQGAGDESGCSPTGNCPIWVFMKSVRGYKVILHRAAIQSFTIQPTRTGGFLDLVLGMHGSAFEQDLHLYLFDKGHYHESACYNASWERLVRDEWQEIKEPDISPCHR